jgi:hypothetical protein
MAVIKLQDIPNAPDLSSMSAARVNNVNIPNVDFSGARAAIARGYASTEQSPANAAAIANSVSKGADAVYKGTKTLADKQQELNDNAAWADFSTNYALKKAELDDSLDQSRPETWAGSYAQFRSKNIDPAWQALPVSVQQDRYAEYLKMTSTDQVKIGHDAFDAKLAGDITKQQTSINLAVEQGDFQAAKGTLDGMRVALSLKQYEATLSKIQTEEQNHQLNSFIAIKPDEWEAKLTDLYSKDEQIPGMSNITKDQIPKFIERARLVSRAQQDQTYSSVSSSITTGEIKSPIDLEKDERFAKIKNDKYRTSLKEAIADRNLGKPEGEEASKYAMHSVATYPQTDDPVTEATKLRVYANENVPSIFRDAVNKALDSKIAEMASNNGRLKPETELVQYGSQRLAVARNGGVFGKFYDPDEVKGSAANAKANIEVMKQVEDVELILRNSGAKTRADVDRVVEEATASGIAKKNAGNLGAPHGALWNWLHSTPKPTPIPDSKPQASSVSGAGKVTSYGYKSDPTSDTNSANGIGSYDNRLTKDSIAISPDIESEGVKMGDKVELTLADGSTVTKQVDDRTAKTYKGKPLKGRFDFYSPEGVHPQDGQKVVSYRVVPKGYSEG